MPPPRLRIRDPAPLELRLLKAPVLDAGVVGFLWLSCGNSAPAVALLRRFVDSGPKIVGGERLILLRGRRRLLHGIRSRSESIILHGELKTANQAAGFCPPVV